MNLVVAGDVVGLSTLSRYGGSVEEGLEPPGRRRGAIAAEVLVVDEDVATVGTDEVWVVNVESVCDEAHLHALSGVSELRRRRCG